MSAKMADNATNSPFTEFLGQRVKAPYNDGGQIKVARGRLEKVDNMFVTITGKSGTIIINSKNIEKMSEVK